MKKFIAILIILLLPTILLADVAAWVSKTDAEKCAVFIKKQKEVKIYCGSCDDKTVQTEEVNAVKAEKVPGDDTYWHVLVNGKEEDLGYLYFKTADGRWRNVALEVGITVEGMDLKEVLTEFIPNDAK